MSQYSYNGTVLPVLPEAADYPYQLIVSISGTEDYYLMLETEPFVVIESRIAFLIDSSYLVYKCTAADTAWTAGTVNIEEGENAYAGIDTRSVYLWSNEDIRDTGGNVVYEGSQPVEVEVSEPSEDDTANGNCLIPSPALILGQLMGRRIAAQRKKVEREPVAYLYNGVRLPALPQRNEENYPNVYIYTVSILGVPAYYVRFTTADPYYATSASGYYCIGRRVGDIIYSKTSNQDDWGNSTESQNEGVEAALNSDLIWSNFDIYNEDGTVFLAASEPIPVYE